MKRHPVVRFWMESMVAGASGLLLMLTLVWRDWFEAIVPIDVDHDNGSLEWFIVAGVLLLAVFSALRAGSHYREYRLSGSST